jgi:uncharacterized protein (TIGR03435 family)
MPDANDMELLQDYARRGSEAAFTELVRRHIALVYSAALRHVGTAAQAEEITQAVFIILARKASGLRPDTILEGWLYETTRLTSLSFMRGERRRQFREQEAYMQSTPQESTDDLLWNQLAPLLDKAMSRLGRKDRDAVILRFFKEKSVREVAATLQVNEATAQRRILRALEKLRKLFTKRGVSSTTAILAGVISANSVQAAPVTLAKAVTATAVMKGAAAGGSTLILVKAALKLMAWAKAQTAIIIGTTVLLAAGTTTVVVKDLAKNEAAMVTEKLSPEDAYLAAGVFLSGNEPPALMVRTTHFPMKQGMYIWETGNFAFAAGRNVGFTGLLNVAYRFKPARMVLPPNVPTTNFDFLATLPNCPMETFQAEIRNTLGWTAHTEMRETNVLLLKVKIASAPGLIPGAAINHSSRWNYGGNVYHVTNMPISDLREFLEDEIFHQPVLDQTGLTKKYDIILDWHAAWPTQSYENSVSLKKVLLEQLGLELVPARERIELLIVERAED